MNVDVGQVVISKAGRDAGRKFIIVKIIDELYVEIADGDLRKLEKPKKKKIKHLAITNEKVKSLEEKLKNGMKVTNADIRKALAGLVSQDQIN